MKTKVDIPEELMAQARAWYVRLADEQAGASEWEIFTLWLEENSLHVDAYNRVELVLTDIYAAQPRTATKNNVVLLSPRPRPSKLHMRVAGIAALMIAALTLFMATNIFQTQPVYTQYATNIGGHEDIILKDGTKISLNTNTQIRVAMSRKTRTVTIKRGEAYFEIAPDNKRPFMVLAQGTTITDIGTAFSVYGSDQALTVSVVDGIVDMSTDAQVVRLKQGQQAVQIRGDSNIAVNVIDIENISTWRDGVLVFEDAALSSIVPELNRYFNTPITLSGDQVANLTFSGVLNINDQDTLLGSMKALMPIKTETQNGQIILSSEN